MSKLDFGSSTKTLRSGYRVCGRRYYLSVVKKDHDPPPNVFPIFNDFGLRAYLGLLVTSLPLEIYPSGADHCRLVLDIWNATGVICGVMTIVSLGTRSHWAELRRDG